MTQASSQPLTQPLVHSSCPLPSRSDERLERTKARKPMGRDKDSLISEGKVGGGDNDTNDAKEIT